MNYLDIPLLSGIYCIKCKENDKLYIGSATSLRRRAYEHFSALRRKGHYNLHLQRAWNLYEEKSFSFEILEICGSKDLIERETFHLRRTKAFDPNLGYNMEHPSPTWLGKRHTPESIEKIRIARAKQVFSKESVAKGAKTRTGRTPNFKPETIEAFRQRSKNMNRDFFKTQEFRDKISKAILDSKSKTCKKIICLNNGKIYSGCGDAGRDLGISHKLVWKVLKGKIKTIHGYSFKYAPEPLPNKD